MQSNLFSNAGSKDLQISCPGNEPLLHHTCQTVTPRDVSVFVSIYQPGNNVINNVEIYKKLHMLDFRTDHTSQNIAIKATVYWWDCSKILLTSSLVSVVGGKWKWYGDGSPIPPLDQCQKSLSFIPAIGPRNDPDSITSIISITWMCQVRLRGCGGWMMPQSAGRLPWWHSANAKVTIA